MSDLVDIKQINPSKAAKDWLDAYRVLLRLSSLAGPEYRRTLRNRYTKAKAIFAAVLANIETRKYVETDGIYYLAVDHDGSPYPAWMPYERKQFNAA